MAAYIFWRTLFALWPFRPCWANGGYLHMCWRTEVWCWLAGNAYYYRGRLNG